MTRAAARRARVVGLGIALALGLALCGCRRPHGPTPRHASAVASAPTLTPEQRTALDWIRKARAAEPDVTRELRAVADAEHATLVGLEHRIKTLASTVSKLERLHAEDPAQALEDIEVYDALRYTLLASDDPPGRHETVIRRTLATLEAEGHAIQRVKNYWPRGDSYSGTNCTLATAAGFPWELQFHTPASFAAKGSVHDDYQRMRDDKTPIGERRRLFDEMRAMWDAIPIPEGILVPGSLHPTEEIRLLPAP